MTKVEQLSLETGKVLSHFSSMGEAAKSVNGFNSGIGIAMNSRYRERKSYKGFAWQRGAAELARKSNAAVPVQQVSLKTGAVLADFSSMAEAAKSVNGDRRNVWAVINGYDYSKSYKGFAWRRAPPPLSASVSLATASAAEKTEACWEGPQTRRSSPKLEQQATTNKKRKSSFDNGRTQRSSKKMASSVGRKSNNRPVKGDFYYFKTIWANILRPEGWIHLQYRHTHSVYRRPNTNARTGTHLVDYFLSEEEVEEHCRVNKYKQKYEGGYEESEVEKCCGVEEEVTEESTSTKPFQIAAVDKTGMQDDRQELMEDSKPKAQGTIKTTEMASRNKEQVKPRGGPKSQLKTPLDMDNLLKDSKAQTLLEFEEKTPDAIQTTKKASPNKEQVKPRGGPKSQAKAPLNMDSSFLAQNGGEEDDQETNHKMDTEHPAEDSFETPDETDQEEHLASPPIFASVSLVTASAMASAAAICTACIMLAAHNRKVVCSGMFVEFWERRETNHEGLLEGPNDSITSYIRVSIPNFILQMMRDELAYCRCKRCLTHRSVLERSLRY
jgi:hypothetical protein